MPAAESRWIRFAEVDWGDTTCLISYGPFSEKLFVSIQMVGLLQQPLLKRKENGLLQIVCGSRRLAVCREMGLEPLPAAVLPSSLPLLTCLRMAIYDNLAHRVLNPVEKALVLTKMAEHTGESQLIKAFMPLLDLEPSEKLLNRYVSLLQLETVILNGLASGSLHERVAAALTPLDQEDRLALFQLFEELPFSVSVQEELLELVVEIAHREGIPPKQVIDGREFEKLRAATVRPARQRARDIRRRLQARRTPRFTARKERFAEALQEVGLPSGVRLAPPPYFEGPQWKLECTFQGTDELVARLRRVVEVAGQPAFKKVIEGRISD